MSKILSDQWEVVITADGSPSLVDRRSPTQEMMHHRGGALSESRYIYEPVLLEVRDRPARILSLGLGLGYNEILCFNAEAQGSEFFELHSFESDPWLRGQFLAWVMGRPCVCSDLYDSILNAVVEIPGVDSIGGKVSADSVRGRLRRALDEGRWVVHAALVEPAQVPAGVHVFLWDAFSRSTSPELWDEDFLKACLAKADTKWARLTTYAQIGPLKRALRAQGFILHERQGFQGKRQSTLASREV